LITTPIALQHHWHINGLWLILTPFLVLRPFVRDAWRVALHRSNRAEVLEVLRQHDSALSAALNSNNLKGRYQWYGDRTLHRLTRRPQRSGEGAIT
jgi:hypothetical protein